MAATAPDPFSPPRSHEELELAYYRRMDHVELTDKHFDTRKVDYSTIKNEIDKNKLTIHRLQIKFHYYPDFSGLISWLIPLFPKCPHIVSITLIYVKNGWQDFDVFLPNNSATFANLLKSFENRLTRFELLNVNLPNISDLVVVLKKCTNLETLIINRGNFGDAGGIQLAEALPNLEKLEYLDIEFSSIRNAETIKLLADSLKQCTKLKVVLVGKSNNMLQQLDDGTELWSDLKMPLDTVALNKLEVVTLDKGTVALNELKVMIRERLTKEVRNPTPFEENVIIPWNRRRHDAFGKEFDSVFGAFLLGFIRLVCADNSTVPDADPEMIEETLESCRRFQLHYETPADIRNVAKYFNYLCMPEIEAGAHIFNSHALKFDIDKMARDDNQTLEIDRFVAAEDKDPEMAKTKYLAIEAKWTEEKIRAAERAKSRKKQEEEIWNE